MKKTNIDSPFYRTMGKIGDLLFANLLWLEYVAFTIQTSEITTEFVILRMV